MILRGDFFRKIRLTEIENTLTHWSVAHACLNDEQNGRSKSRWTVEEVA